MPTIEDSSVVGAFFFLRAKAAVRKRKRIGDVEYFLHKRKRKTPIYGTTMATGDFLAIVHEDNPELTIAELKELLEDDTRFIREPEAIACLDAYIKYGEGDVIPQFKYR